MIGRMMILAALFLLSATTAGAGGISERATPMGAILTDAAGMTLYVFDKDEPGKSNCLDTCAANWPPALADTADMAKPPYSIITRADGSKQWAHGGKPLYRWAKDAKPGDATGDGFRDIWHVAKPMAAPVMVPEPASPMKSGY
ncbi:conserved exported hypothetical protein [Magnetospirillum sp. LM-5]|uniref:COG4315 family predicted lipoprotein n=1 Tax=Magnetospirillum sp. LM-5 TaxID=2681466 RepID=UPI001382DEA8|nr:hypothetical protein [Magnetospirillum sp. LM-5]CAA7614969.1 conserved exported hypothetical protein [Magnetospirillum sp. LM-5]